MQESDLIRTMELYAHFMEEIKIRLKVIQKLLLRLQHDKKPPEAFVDAESAFLQMRLVCELVALAALAAHDPKRLTSDMKKTWSAERAFVDLAKLNPHCFPRPISVQDSTGTRDVFMMSGEGILNREGLKDIYTSCGGILHRGALKRVLKGERRTYDLSKINTWTAAISNLLRRHVILILEERKAFLVELAGGIDGSVAVELRRWSEASTSQSAANQ